ncbi:MAG: RdgB/HAM1 family non-canonical purine NTP pyrophosphatase [Aureliella sp.]
MTINRGAIAAAPADGILLFMNTNLQNSETVASQRIPAGSEIVIGTTNAKKLVELTPYIQPLGFPLKILADFPNPLEVDETGTTFLENARLKASQQAQHLGRWTIGEDSGLCVPALDGAPGIYSARYSGPEATDEKNNQKLLLELGKTPPEKRAAYYVSTMALASPDGTIQIEAEGRCWGRIIDQYRGSGGFGYDPLFEIPEYHRTFAELGGTVKRALSHRGRALGVFVQKLRRIMEAAQE